MGLKFELKVDKRKQKRVQKKIQNLHNEYVEVGYFKEQGMHSLAKVPYAVLIHWHHTGIPGKFKARPIFTILKLRIRGNVTRYFKPSMMKWGKSNKTLSDTKRLLNEVGEMLVKKTKYIFGKAPLLENSPATVAKKGFDRPMIETGELRDKLAYRTSIDKKIVEDK